MSDGSSRQRWDAVIIGAGASGLSLALSLAEAWPEHRVLVVDDGLGDVDGRSWAYWSAAAVTRPVDTLAALTFDRFRVHALGRAATLDLGPYRYRVVTGLDLRRAVEQRIASTPGFAFVSGRVTEVESGPKSAVVRVDRVPAVEATWVFDSRTPAPRTNRPRLWLAFAGWEVETGRDVFEADAATFFDFRCPGAVPGSFWYVIPSSPRRALVELTTFTPVARPNDAAARTAERACLHAYLNEILDTGSFQIRRQERGQLPLVAAGDRQCGDRVLRIGIAGGMLKISSGYAFERIQRDCEAIADSLRRSGHPFARPTPKARHAYLDQVLLAVLAADPGAVESVFAQLFRANPASRVLRFLDEDLSPVQEVRLIASLDPWPFLRAALLLLRCGRDRIGPLTGSDP